jgi:hypothetical protein
MKNDPEDNYGKRITDVDKTQEIEALIMKEEDEKHRTLLLVVHSLNSGVREQTAALCRFQDALLKHQEKLDSYIQEQQSRVQKVESFINQGKGVKMALGWGMKVLIGVFMLLNSLVIAIGGHYVSQIDNLQELAQANVIQHAELYARMQLPQPPQITLRKEMPDEPRSVK